MCKWQAKIKRQKQTASSLELELIEGADEEDARLLQLTYKSTFWRGGGGVHRRGALNEGHLETGLQGGGGFYFNRREILETSTKPTSLEKLLRFGTAVT